MRAGSWHRLVGVCALLWAGTAVDKAVAAPADALVLKSPNGKVSFTIVAEARGRLAYEIAREGRPVIERSNLGLKVDGVDLGAGVDLSRMEPYSIDEKYPYRGVHSEAVNRCSGAKLPLRHAGGTSYTLDVRVFDDAAAFRFIVPGTGERVPDAATTFRVPEDAVVWYHGFADGHYEDIYDHKAVQEITAGEWAAPPVTFKLPAGGGYASITEAALRNYAGMGLQADGQRGFRESLAHEHPPNYPFVLRYPKETVERLAKPAAVEGVITTPWRVVIVGPDLNTLVNSDVLPNLNPPPDPKLFPEGIKAAWLTPGRAVWDYLDSEELVPPPTGGDPETNRRRRSLAQQREFSRLAGELGFEYNVVEGVWRRWSPQDLRDFIAYSKERGVRVLLWVHSNGLHDPEARRKLFAEVRDAGAAGLKVDFFDHEAKEWVDLYQAVLKDGAEHQLVFDFHGANKPTGEPRTWPNELTREAIKGMETSRLPAWGEHNTTWPFTRLLAGHADFTPMVFGNRRRETSWAHQIASAAILTSPLLIYGANPKTMLEHPAADMIKSLPASWDQTIVLPPSEVGDLALFARRVGDKWFLAATNNELVKDLKVDLSFLEKGRKYQVSLVKDLIGVDAPADKVELETRSVTGGTGTFDVSVRGGGGFVARFTPQ
jgi:alpha-glucosidase